MTLIKKKYDLRAGIKSTMKFPGVVAFPKLTMAAIGSARKGSSAD